MPLDVKNIFEIDEDNLEWLDIKIPNEVYNPLTDGPAQDPIDEIVGLMMNTDYLHFATKFILNKELLPYQLVILDTLWRKKLPILISSRGSAKSFLLAIYSLLRLIFHPGCKIVICGSGFRQSKIVFDYMADIWNAAPILRDIAGNHRDVGPRRGNDRCTFAIGLSECHAIPIGDGTKIRGIRANYIISDEFASINEEIFNVVVQGFGLVASSPVDKVKEASLVNRLKKLGLWTAEMQELRKSGNKGNQVIRSGTAYYSFNHFYKNFKKWHDIISSKGDMKKIQHLFHDSDSLEGFNWTDFAIIRIPYTAIPDGMLDPLMISQAKATLHTGQFQMELGSCFPSDSNGFYKRSVIESATTNKPLITPNGSLAQFTGLKFGNKDRSYVISVDPAADEDNAAIVVLELYPDHRRVVHCWTTNRKKYGKIKKEMAESGTLLEDDYYRYIATKIKNLMSIFNTESIQMDKNGGGTAIAEALGSRSLCQQGEVPILEIIDPDEPKNSDSIDGLHILTMVAPTNEFNSDANHGMLKDLQTKALLFPMFDTIELEKSIQLDKINDLRYDTFEEIIQEIEELKNEMTTIVMTASSTLGKEVFDTPTIKLDNHKKGKLKKDRYSALLYGNYYARNKDKDEMSKITYKPVGGTARTFNMKKDVMQTSALYVGPGAFKLKNNKVGTSLNSYSTNLQGDYYGNANDQRNRNDY